MAIAVLRICLKVKAQLNLNSNSRKQESAGGCREVEVPPMTRVPPMMVAPMTSPVVASHFLPCIPVFGTTLLHSFVLGNVLMHLSWTIHE